MNEQLVSNINQKDYYRIYFLFKWTSDLKAIN